MRVRDRGSEDEHCMHAIFKVWIEILERHFLNVVLPALVCVRRRRAVYPMSETYTMNTYTLPFAQSPVNRILPLQVFPSSKEQ